MAISSEMGIVGAVVMALVTVLGLFKYFSDHIKEQNQIYSEINTNLIKNTMAIDNLNNYMKRLENDFKSRLDEYEKRLDQHHDQIAELRVKISTDPQNKK